MALSRPNSVGVTLEAFGLKMLEGADVEKTRLFSDRK